MAWSDLGAGLRSAAAATAAAALLAALAACGGANTTGELVSNLDGTLSSCTIADGATTCQGTVVWYTRYASLVSVQLDGQVIGTAAAGSAAPVLAYGPATLTLVVDGNVVATATLSGQCAGTSFWNGGTCVPASAFALGPFSVVDGAADVDVHAPLAGSATQALGGGSATIACHDRDDASLALAVTAAVEVAAGQYTIAPQFAGYPELPHHADCTLSATLRSLALQSAPLGPIRFTTGSGPALARLLATAGAAGLPWLVDPAAGTQASPPEMASHLGNCVGAWERFAGRVRSFCGISQSGTASVWDIEPDGSRASPVHSLDSLFSTGATTDPQLLIDARRNEYFTRGALQADGSSNSAVIVVTPAGGHTTIAWDWAGRHDWITRLVLDEGAGRLFAVSHLGLVQVISLASLAVVDTFDIAQVVNDALVSQGQLVVSIRAAADGSNLRVYDPVARALRAGVDSIPGGKAAQGLALSGADLLVAGSDAGAGQSAGKLCRLDPASFTLRAGTPCTATGSPSTPLALAATAAGVFGDLGPVLTQWLPDLSAPTPLQTYDGPVTRLRVIAN